jgi:hypothetical protein
MGMSDSDIAQEMYDDERAAAEHRARDQALFQERFNRIFDGIQNNERLPLVEWVIPLGEILKDRKFSRSAARLQILKALAHTPDFKIDRYRDEMDVYDLIELIVPPVDAPGWGKVGRPKSLRHRVYRMVDDGLLKAHGEGRMTETLSLTPLGAFHAHQSHVYPGADLLGYFRWHKDTIDPDQGRPGPVWDNPFYNDVKHTGTANPHDEFQLTTPGASKWPSLRRLHEDPWEYHMSGRLEEYGLTLKGLLKAVDAIYEEQIDECLKVLTDYDRQALIEEVLTVSGISNARARDDLVSQIDTGPYASRFTKMVAYFEDDHPDEDGGTVVANLIIRSAWVVVRQVMDHRMNDDYETNIIKRAEQGDPNAIIEVEDYRNAQGWVDPEEYAEEMAADLYADMSIAQARGD